MGGQSFRPEIKRKLHKYKQREKEEAKRIDALMEEKQQEHKRQTDPERLRALEHFNKLADGAEDPTVLARLRAIIDSGSAAQYWSEVSPILEQRLVGIQERLAKSTAEQTFSATEATEARAEAAEAQELLTATDA